MPRIEPKDPALKTLTGLHLWHAPMSSCSQRVRIVMAETGQDFESHLVNLQENEHATEAYQRIHPKGLVPALVDDGDLIIESIDIIRHLAGRNVALAQTTLHELLEMADAAQLDLKLLTYEFLFRAAPPPPETAEAFQARHQNEWLKQFRRDFAVGFDRDRVEAAVQRTDEGFHNLDALLSDGRAFLAGEEFTLADIAWMPNLHRFDLMGWPYERTPNLKAWFDKVSQRPSYYSALEKWEDAQAVEAFTAYTERRRAAGTDIRSLGGLSD
ncbi:glutathione S-transferase family protein [Halomonas sp. LR5S13]|uniref:glutathione S-transferase family protein n=1 Tax=Halomonas rhizosphaerae TaxID=3043296 RepID=UPI0024A7C2FB|nr:glutathione S-transferase family protein [Halomonas rhizosphaerae]MDI5922665.1 glutathione S-transferase family protein [Halomonas rhizosphaerae]